VKFSGTVDGSASFHNSVFEKQADFSNANFKNKARFQLTKFKGKAFFDNTKFDDLADFWGAEFNQAIIFFKTDFLGVTVFSTTIFYENVLFTYTLIEKVVIFRGTNFHKGLDLSLIVSEGSFSLFDIRLNDFNAEPDPEDDEDYQECVSETAIITEKNKRETFRALKKQFQNQGNNFDALTYSAVETKTYRHQLERQIFEKGIWKRNIQNYIILGLNHLSNKNNRSWLRGIAFTFIVGFVFFYFSVIATEKYSIGFDNMSWVNFFECVKYYFSFLTPTHKIEYMEELKPKTFYYVWDFMGRVFVAYGIYQTVQAFRKFKGTSN